MNYDIRITFTGILYRVEVSGVKPKEITKASDVLVYIRKYVNRGMDVCTN